MKTTCLGFLVLLLSALASPASAGVGAAVHLGPAGPPTVDVGFFYDELAPYGHWIETPQYGWAWTPAVDAAWRPYADGQWAQTAQGWTWLSDEPFGWATYHYGRWSLDPVYSWMWIPGNEWGPAWVDWRASDDYIGWAPLPPSYTVRPRFAFRSMDVGLPPESYLFVPEPLFLRQRVVAYALPPGQAKKLFRGTRSFTRYRMVDNLIVNEGVPVARIQRRIGRPVPRFQVVELGLRDRRERRRFADDRVALFRPRIERSVVAVPPARRIAGRAVMTPLQAAEIRRVARARTTLGFGPPRIAGLPRPDRVKIRSVVSPPTPRSRSFRDDRGSRGRAEVRRLPRAAPAREMKVQRRGPGPSPRISSSGSHHQPQRQTFRQPDRGQRKQRAVRPDRHGGGRRSAMRGPGGGSKGKRGGGRGH